MSPWKLVYPLTKRLSQNEKNFEIILYCLNKSIELSSKFHDVKIVTDSETIDYLNELDVEKQIFDFGHLRFLDDIKISVLPHIKHNEILVDPDVFIYRELKIDTNCDLICERPERIRDNWYKEDYILAKEFKFSKFISLKSDTEKVSNIGILKFFNNDFLKTYLETYNLVKSVALEEETKLYPFPTFSILLGQLLLQNLIDKNECVVKYIRDDRYNQYYHLAGPQKYDKDYLLEVVNRKSKTSVI